MYCADASQGPACALACPAALLALERGKRVRVFLTAVGGGAFGNRSLWIASAIDRAIRASAAFPLDVMLVSFGKLPGCPYAALGKGIGGDSRAASRESSLPGATEGARQRTSSQQHQ